MTTKWETNPAREQADAQLEHVWQLMQWHSHANNCESSRKCDHDLEAVSDYGLTFNESFDVDTVTQAINETPLSIEVNYGWHDVSEASQGIGTPRPGQYRILLCTGVRIVGELVGYGEPKTARLEYQDSDTPWTDYGCTYVIPFESNYLLNFASMLYYGG